ncbi:MAG: alpha/beta fold hydrolase [Burkholderiaceae bacterium]
MTTAPEHLEVRRIGARDPRRPCLVFLHEGLGSVSMWRDFPDRLARACGLPAMIYSRHGYGRSPAFCAPLAPDFMHRAAQCELPALLRHCDIGPTILVGHSDGGSIALLYAATARPPPLGSSCWRRTCSSNRSVRRRSRRWPAAIHPTRGWAGHWRGITAMRPAASRPGPAHGWRRHLRSGTSSRR